MQEIPIVDTVTMLLTIIIQVNMEVLLIIQVKLYKSFLPSAPFTWYYTPYPVSLSLSGWMLSFSERMENQIMVRHWHQQEKLYSGWGSTASLVLSTFGLTFKDCVLTQSAHMPFIFFGSQSISFLLAPQLVLLDLQGHKPVVTTDWLWFVMIVICGCGYVTCNLCYLCGTFGIILCLHSYTLNFILQSQKIQFTENNYLLLL